VSIIDYWILSRKWTLINVNENPGICVYLCSVVKKEVKSTAKTTTRADHYGCSFFARRIDRPKNTRRAGRSQLGEKH